jgi:hypothetical protein
MKREKVKDLIREYLTLRKKAEKLQEELRGLRGRFENFGDLTLRKKTEMLVQEEIGELRRRFEKVGDLLYGYRSKTSIHSVISCVLDLGREYDKDKQYHDFLTNLISIVRHFEEYDADRRVRVSQRVFS